MAYKTFTITADEYREGHDAGHGICLVCGEITYGGVEPDARGYPCEECGDEQGVYGLSEALIMGRITVEGDEDADEDEEDC